LFFWNTADTDLANWHGYIVFFSLLNRLDYLNCGIKYLNLFLEWIEN